MNSEVYRTLANLVFALHIVVIVYLLGSTILVSTGFLADHPSYQKAHFLFVGTVIGSQIIFGGCPLVALESALRHQYDPSIQPGGSFTVALIRHLVGVSVPIMVVTITTYLIFVVALAGWVWTRIAR